jgi:hypothetical protein
VFECFTERYFATDESYFVYKRIFEVEFGETADLFVDAGNDWYFLGLGIFS